MSAPTPAGDEHAQGPATFGGDVGSRAVHALLLVAAIGHALFFLLADLRHIVLKVPDDTFYYMEIARRLARGEGMTFDGLSPTNGFQPLWMIVLVPIHAVTNAAGASREAAFRTCMVAAVGVAAAACSMAFRALRSLAPGIPAVPAGIAVILVVFRGAVSGMESGVAVLALVALFAHGARVGIATTLRRADALAFGAILGLVILARLDSIFLAGAVLASLLAGFVTRRERLEPALFRFAWAAVGTALVLLPYLLHNRLVFGHLMPVSGQLKSSFPVPYLANLGLRMRGAGLMPLADLAIAIGHLVWFFTRSPARGPLAPGERHARGAAAVLSAGVVIHFLHEILFMKWGIQAWHFVSGILVVPAVLAAVWRPDRHGAAARRAGKLALGAAVALAVVSTARRLSGDGGGRWHVAAYDAARWVRQSTPPGAVLAMKDAGIVGYFSERRVVNLDGVVNDLAYQEALRDGRLGAYLRERGAGYLIQHALVAAEHPLFWSADGGRRDVLSGDYVTISLRYRSHKYEASAEPIVVERAREVYRSEPYLDEGSEARLLIWSLPAARP